MLGILVVVPLVVLLLLGGNTAKAAKPSAETSPVVVAPSKHYAEPGDIGVLNDDAVMGKTEDDLRAIVRGARIDDKEGLALLVLQGRSAFAYKGMSFRVLNVGWGGYHIRMLEGPLYAEDWWIDREWYSPAPKVVAPSPNGP